MSFCANIAGYTKPNSPQGTEGVTEETFTLTGIVERITYVSDETGYSVIRLKPETPLTLWDAVDTEGLITVVGVFPELIPGETVEVHGAWNMHPRHGTQFKADSLKRSAPTTIEGITRYLGSGMIRGIGPKTAERIVSTFGSDTLTVLDKEPERLFEVKGVGKHRVRTMMQAWDEQKSIRDVMLFLQSHGISTGLAVRIYKVFGDQSVACVQEDPYQLTEAVRGIGFRTADMIAMNTGLIPDHPRRLKAALVYILTQAAQEGDVFLPSDDLIQRCATLVEISPERLASILEDAATERKVIIEKTIEYGKVIYLPEMHKDETGVSGRLRKLLDRGSPPLLPADTVSEQIGAQNKEDPYDLTELQAEAIRIAILNPISVITGGPGTGKTTIIRTLIQLLKKHEVSFLLASPTGRAAKRLSEATGAPASTIHRLLGYSPATGWAFDAFQPLMTDIIIIDEASMLDLQLAHAFFRGVHPATHLVFVGDIDQLPSVGAGDFLRDLIESGRVPVTRLNIIFRQQEGSTIIRNAHRIRQGEMPVFPDETDDFFLFRISDDAERANALVVDVVKNRLPQRFSLDPMEDIQVIVPMYRGDAGILRLNEALQAALNPSGGKAERMIGGRIYRVGDKVLQTSNDYNREIFNGDIGRITDIDTEESTVSVRFDSRLVSFDFSEITDLLHAYAISVHRSQGSEYPAIVMPIITQHYVMLQRNLLYTAITRARKLAVLIGSPKAIGIAVRNDTVTRRNSLLSARLQGEI